MGSCQIQANPLHNHVVWQFDEEQKSLQEPHNDRREMWGLENTTSYS